jgi:hypothetical protein
MSGAGTFMETVGEVAAASVVEVVVKEPKQISVGLARMSAMLARKTTQQVPGHPYLAHQLSGDETWQIC